MVLIVDRFGTSSRMIKFRYPLSDDQYGKVSGTFHQAPTQIGEFRLTFFECSLGDSPIKFPHSPISLLQAPIQV